MFTEVYATEFSKSGCCDKYRGKYDKCFEKCYDKCYGKYYEDCREERPKYPRCPPPPPCPPCPAGPQLYCVSDVGAVRFEGEEDELVIWQDITELKIKGKECANVLHDVSGIIHARFEDSDDTAAVADFEFRIIDSFGHCVCTRRIRYAAGFPEDVGDTEVLFPFSFKCCDRIGHCDDGVLYRLQADLLDERLASNNDVWIQDITWSAIVFPEDEKKDC